MHKLLKLVSITSAAVLLTGCATSTIKQTQAKTIDWKSTANGVTQTVNPGVSPKWVIAVHGGSGVKAKDVMTDVMRAAYTQALDDALNAGGNLLERGGTATEAVEAALMVLENSPLFNAGRGGAVNADGVVRTDASIMRGEDHWAGAIAAGSRIKNPIRAARAVMEHTENVLLEGEAVDEFAQSLGLDMSDPEYFITPERRQLQIDAQNKSRAMTQAEIDMAAFGTTGAVVLDTFGNLAAGTTTGGRTNKRRGRVGDSPIIGAGTYASNTSCAVSGTGHGEYFMRYTVARDICAKVEFAGMPLEEAAHDVMINTLGPVGGSGAIIAMAPDGQVVFSMNGRGAYRGVMSSELSARTAVYKDETVTP